MITVVDLGNYNVKAMNSLAVKSIFKSNISRDYESYPDAFKHIKIDGEYTYFEKGPFSMEYIKTKKDYTAQLMYSIASLNEEVDEIKTNLTLLLPISEIQEKNKYIDGIKGKTFDCSVKLKTKRNKKIIIEDVMVLPEGYVIYFKLGEKYKTSSIVIIDIGGRTTNLVAMVNGEPKVLKTLKIGALDFYAKIRELHADKEYNLEDIERLIKEGKIVVTDKQIAQFANDILNQIKQHIKLEHYEHVLFAGGGALIIEKIIKDILPDNCEIVDGPLESNMEGAMEASKLAWNE
ncbi:ParM/StbA family protein [Clostridium butyricum]|uniref:ParM/StbA family protein n=1 Tax=Clostridium butyricum TaxID=1492 RepID=UPI0006E6610D|nr:ParM/StbA family protein [Clostridium butyricum]KQB77135.1 exopolyphosphatase [Clostridium butyricum]